MNILGSLTYSCPLLRGVHIILILASVTSEVDTLAVIATVKLYDIGRGLKLEGNLILNSLILQIRRIYINHNKNISLRSFR